MLRITSLTFLTLLFLGSVSFVDVRQADAIDIALLGGETDGKLEEVRIKLLATGKFNTIAKFEVGTEAGTPTLAELNQYDAVLVWSNQRFFRGPTPSGEYFPLANALAAYIDGGGGVVLGCFSYSQAWRLHGDFRFKTAADGITGYYALAHNGGSVGAVPNQTLGVYNASHPIMSGVSSFASGPNSFLTSRTARPEATVVAALSNGDPLVVERTIGDARRIDLAMYPISALTSPNSWDPLTDGNLIIANSLVYVAKRPSCNTLEDVQDELLDIIVSASPEVADKVEDVFDKVLTAIDEREKPDLQAAVGTMEGAVGDLEAAVKDGLLGDEGLDLMCCLAKIARGYAEDAIVDAILLDCDPDKIVEAVEALDEGDELLDNCDPENLSDFKDAVNKYKDAISKAESACG